MIECRMMDDTCLLCRCVHDGPVPLAEALSPADHPPPAEADADLPPGTIARFLRALCRNYGSCGVLAVDGEAVVGKVRFCPQEIADAFYPAVCLLAQDRLRTLAAFDPAALPTKSALRDRTLYLCCFQLVHDYKAAAEGRPAGQPSYLGQGIATQMLETLIDWARAGGWRRLRAKAVQDIRPLKMWSMWLSVERYRKLGFQATPSATDTVEAALHQRRGYHGEAMKEMWQPYAGVSDEEVTRMYDVVLDLARPGGASTEAAAQRSQPRRTGDSQR